MPKKLSKRQKDVLDVLKEYMDSNGFAPTLSEMMEALDISTKKGVAFHLDALEKKGYLSRTGEARGIILSNDDSGDFLSIPILGYANAGTPLLLAQEDFIGELTVEKTLLKSKRKVFGLEIRGDSMDKKVMNGIPMKSGNYALIVKDMEINNGDVVLAVINGAATIKTFQKDGKTVALYPESSNPVHKPIYVQADDDSFINGRILTVLNNPGIEEDN